ncbi:MAG: acetyl-CoA carboxylase biotin carboxyl carrier protein, partial [Longicatena sp.]
GDEKIVIKKEKMQNLSPQISYLSQPQAIPVVENSDSNKASQQGSNNLSSNSTINSPMVGVFYCSPSPESKPFVSVGDSFKKGDVLCIIEAMKVMNEITAEKDGIIKTILLQSGDVVEYGQSLFEIE